MNAKELAFLAMNGLICRRHGCERNVSQNKRKQVVMPKSTRRILEHPDEDKKNDTRH